MPQQTTTATEHPIATAIGKSLGTVARMTGFSAAPPPDIVEPNQRLPRKLKKALKKKGMLQGAITAGKE